MSSRRYAAWPFLISASVMLYLAPRIVLAAAIRPAAVAFATGLMILLAGPYRAYTAQHKRLVPLVW